MYAANPPAGPDRIVGSARPGRGTERRIRERSAFAVGRRRDQVAVRHVVAVGIGPAAGRGHIEQERIVLLRERGLAEHHVPAGGGLQRRLAVAEQVVGDPEPWREVLPVRQIVDGRPRLGWRERPRPARLVVGNPTDVAVEPDAGVDREPPERPLILGEEAENPVFLDLMARLYEDRDRRRNRVAQRVVHALSGVAPLHVVLPPLEVRAHLGDMTAGDVGRGGFQVRHPVAPAVFVRIAGGRRSEREAGPDIDGPDDLIDTCDGGIEDDVVVDVAVHRFEHEPGRDGRLPGHLEHVVVLQREPLIDRGLEHAGTADAHAHLLARLRVHVEAQLVLRGGLPREAPAHVSVPVGVEVWLVQIHVAGGAERRVVREGERVDRAKCACHGLLLRPSADRREKPQFVGLDRSANRCVDVVDVPQLVHRVQTTAAQVVVQVAALKVAARIGTQKEAGEAVAPFLGNHVRAHTTRLRFGRQRGRLVDELLSLGRIERLSL